MQRKKKLCGLLVLFAVLLFWQGWGMRTVWAQTEETPRASSGEESVAQVTDTFTDSYGITYKWKGFEDGTAEIYEFTVGADVVDIVLDIPGEIEGYTVTRITGKLRDTEIKTVTIPESVVQFGEDTFERSTIGTLNYNAVDAFPIREFYYTPFGYAEIGHLNLGTNVNKIESYLFYHTVIKQDEVVLNVPYIADGAFTGATLEAIRLTNDIEYLGRTAFDDTEIKYVYYDCLEAEISAKSLTEGPFRHAVIGGIEFCQELTEIPDYLFCGARFEISTLTIDKERIGDYAFYSVWNTEILSTGYDRADRLSLTENVKYVGKCAFESCYINEVVILSDLELMAESTTEGPFHMSHIYGITLGEAVSVLPDYLFSNANFHMEKLTVDKPHIGRACFYNVWDKYAGDIVPAELTVTENVEYIGGSAFAYNMLSKLNYNADAANDSKSTTDGAFSSCELASISLGSNVNGIPAYFFSNTKFLQDIDLTIEGPIGQYAFNAAASSYGGFGHLVLGENVTSIGKSAFNNRAIESLSYNAVWAVVDIKNTGDAPFSAITIGSLTIGDKVELLDKSLMCGVNLTQEELVIPDSVQEIGNYFFYNMYLNMDGVQIGTLRIGSGLKKLQVNSFRSIQFTDIYVDAVEAGEDYDSKIAGGYTGYLPKSENLYIHHDSDFYNYFSQNAGEIHLYCDSYMESSTGEEYLDKVDKQYITPAYETCAVCGYQITTESRVDAFSVTFKVMGKVVDEKYCKSGGSVEPPQAPACEGYVFGGWDTSCEGITEDRVVNAVFSEEIKQCHVTVHAVYADGTESEKSVFDVPVGEVITLPEYAPSLGNHMEDGYEGERTFAPEFDWNIGEHNGTYEVRGDIEIVARETNYYVVQFVNEAGEVINTQKVHSGYDAVPPVIENGTVSGNDGVITISWALDYFNVTGDRTVRMESSKDYYVYAVSFTDEAGTVLKSCNVTHGTAAEPPAGPEKEADAYYSYVFQGWVCGPDNSSTVECVVKDTIFRPVYTATAIAYIVQFEVNGGSPVSPAEVEGGKKLKEPEPPTREGYEFAGWYRDAALTERYEFASEVKSDMTLYAGWEEKEVEPTPDPVPRVYKVQFEVNGGSPVSPAEVEDGKKLEEPEPPTREGYEFAGWYRDAVLTERYEFESEVKSDMTLYAGWEEKEAEPTPSPEPSPAPEPSPSLEPSPSPESSPSPELTPSPEPIPIPSPEPTPSQEPTHELKENGDPRPYGSGPSTPKDESASRKKGIGRVVLPVAASVAVGAGGFGGYFFLFWRRRRKIIGTVIDVDGDAIGGICVQLDGRKTVSNEKGEFAIYGVRRGCHNLSILYPAGKEVLSMEILMDEAGDREPFYIVKDETIKTDVHREGKRYFVEVVLLDEN